MRLHGFLLSTTLLLAAQTALAASYGKHDFADTSALAEGQWVKVALSGTEDGVYQITYDQLRSMGFSQPERVGVYGFGGHVLSEKLEEIAHDDLPEVAIYQDTRNKRILFYGQGLIRWDYSSANSFYQRQNPYETEAYYFLHQKADAPRIIEPTQDAVMEASSYSDTYLALGLHETESVNIGQSGREKYGESFLSTPTQTFTLGNYAAGDVKLTVNAIAKSTAASSFALKVNGAEIGNIKLNAYTSSYTFATEGSLKKSFLLDDDSEVQVSLTYQSTEKADLARLNYIVVEGQRSFVLPETSYTFRGKNAQRGFDLHAAFGAATDSASLASSPYQIWDVSSATDIRRQTLATGARFTPSADSQGRPNEYVFVNTEARAFPTVRSLGKIANQNLHALPATDMVIVTAPAYLTEANRLAEYRRTHDGLHVIVVTPQAIYNEFSSGGQDVTAIRLLMKKLQPRYLLLIGKGYYDNQKINRQYLLPCYETDNSLAETSSCVCDDYFGFIEDGEGGTLSGTRYTIEKESLDIGIGRLPVSSESEAKDAIDKIIAYSNNRYQGAWKSRLCFLSDDDKQGDSFNAHVRHNDQLVASLEKAGHKEYAMQKIYLPAYRQTSSASGTDYPDAKKEFLESLKQGVLMVNYAGHGNTSSLTHEEMMTSAIASQLSMRYLPVWVTASCDVGRWDNDERSLGERLTLNPNGGAIAMFTTVRIVYAHQNLILNHAIIDNLFNRFDDGTRYRLGDVLKAAKRSLGTDYNKLNFCLMGDPSLTMAYPEHQIAVTEVNGQPVDETTGNIPLQALETVTMRGVVYKTGSRTEIDSTFNGIIFPTLYDALDTLTADKGYVQDDADPYRFTTRTRKAFSGRGEVKNGQFEFSFMVPQDIAYSSKPGLATLYACSSDWTEAQGYFDKYQLTGGQEIIRTDTLGPVINRLFLNDMLFSEGAVVNSTPYFYAEVSDESGFNTTGNGIGHDMVLTIKCTSNPLLSVKQYILNNYFSTYTGRFNVGNVQYSIPALEDGDYEASFTVWDVFNNASRKIFHFTVAKGKAPSAVAVQAYPSPAKSGDPLTFRVLHNRPESQTEMHLEVYNALGHLVYETNVKNNQATKYYATDLDKPTIANASILADETPNFMGSTSIVWSAPDLGAGFYVYRIVLTSNGSQQVSESKILIIDNK